LEETGSIYFELPIYLSQDHFLRTVIIKMAPKSETPSKRRKKEGSQTPPSDSDANGMFSGMFVFLVDAGVQPRRLQVMHTHQKKELGKIWNLI